MKNQKGFIQIPVIIAIVIGVLVIGGIGYFGVRQYQGYQTEKIEKEKLAQEAQQQKDLEVEKLKQEVEALKNSKPKTIVKEVPKSESSVASTVDYWRPRVVHIECHFQNKVNPGNNLISSGSGLYMGDYGDGPLFVLTNAHVVAISNQVKTVAADFCYLQLPDDPDVMVSSDISAGSGWTTGRDLSQDAAIVKITNPTEHLKSIRTKTQFCLDPGSVGDELIVLGYPGIGSSEDVTVTRGIISGYEGYYYVTDAKIEHGNSGGVAVLVKKGCNLGIPTAAVSGEIESLGRILGGDTALSWLAH